MEGIRVSLQMVGPKNDVAVISVGGYLDTTTSPELEQALKSVIANNKSRIVIDLKETEYISSAGWGSFIADLKKVRAAGGDIKLARMLPEIKDIFEMLEFNRVFKPFATIGEAVASFGIDPKTLGKDIENLSPPKESVPEQKKPTLDKTAPVKSTVKTPITTKKTQPVTVQKVDKSKLSLDEKILDIIRRHPALGAKRISEELYTEEYGYTSVGWFSIWWKLWRKGLDTKEKRKKYVEGLRDKE